MFLGLTNKHKYKKNPFLPSLICQKLQLRHVIGMEYGISRTFSKHLTVLPFYLDNNEGVWLQDFGFGNLVTCRSIKNIFSIDCANIYFFLSMYFVQWKSMGLTHIAYIVIY